MRTDLATAKHAAQKALDGGGMLTGPRTVSWGISGRCSDPKAVELNGRPTRMPLPSLSVCHRGRVSWTEGTRFLRDTHIRDGAQKPLFVDMLVRCRRCPNCLAVRGALWTQRIINEVNCANRTWFGTITLNPHEHFLVQCRAEQAVGDFTRLSEAEKFRALHGECSKLLTRYVKRLRKHGGGGLRFIAVAERHKSGLPHYHMLAHEPHVVGASLSHRLLTEQWPHGFTKWKLVKEAQAAARYVAKYLFKSSEARVRASVAYGEAEAALALAGRMDRVKENPSPGEGKKEEKDR